MMKTRFVLNWKLILFQGALCLAVSPHGDESPVLFLLSPLEADWSNRTAGKIRKKVRHSIY